MKENVTYILDPEDIELIKKVSKYPCPSCMERNIGTSDYVLGCINCSKRLEYTEIVKSIPEENRETIQELADAYREYVEAVETIEKLQAKIEKLKSEYNIDKLVNFK